MLRLNSIVSGLPRGFTIGEDLLLFRCRRCGFHCKFFGIFQLQLVWQRDGEGIKYGEIPYLVWDRSVL